MCAFAGPEGWERVRRAVRKVVRNDEKLWNYKRQCWLQFGSLKAYMRHLTQFFEAKTLEVIENGEGRNGD